MPSCKTNKQNPERTAIELLNTLNLEGVAFKGGKENRLLYEQAHCRAEYENEWRE